MRASTVVKWLCDEPRLSCIHSGIQTTTYWGYPFKTRKDQKEIVRYDIVWFGAMRIEKQDKVAKMNNKSLQEYIFSQYVMVNYWVKVRRTLFFCGFDQVRFLPV